MIKKQTLKKAIDMLVSKETKKKIANLRNKFFTTWRNDADFANYHSMDGALIYDEDLEAATKRGAYKVDLSGGIGFEKLIDTETSMPKQLIAVYKYAEKAKKDFEAIGFSDVDIVYTNAGTSTSSKNPKPQMMHQFWLRIPLDAKHKQNLVFMRLIESPVFNYVVSRVRE